MIMSNMTIKIQKKLNNRYICLTDINRGIEIDDIQSLIRLLVYSNDIDIKGIIVQTSCFVKKIKDKNEWIVRDLIDQYQKVLPNLLCHSNNYPTSQYLNSITALGIPTFGGKEGIDFACKKYNDNKGVAIIVNELLKDDDRLLHFGLWAGASTLAQALWILENRLDEERMHSLLHKVVIYGISDQDYACKWIRKHYGQYLTYIVTPSNFTSRGAREYYKAAWPGISGDKSAHGSEDGVNKTRGFKGADPNDFNRKWIKKNIRIKGPLGRKYLYPRFLSEGDTPSFLGVINNGLNNPNDYSFGGWGGRYVLQEYEGEDYPIYSNASDCVKGSDGQIHCSTQATIWRWRHDFQNDFAMRMNWCIHPMYDDCYHYLKIKESESNILATLGQIVTLKIELENTSKDIKYDWILYKEASKLDGDIKMIISDNMVTFETPKTAAIIHIIAKIQLNASDAPVTYKRFIIKVQ